MTPTPSSAASLRTALVPFAGLWADADRAGPRRTLNPLAGLLARFRAAARHRRAKRQLLALDDRMLKDIGCTRSDVLWYAVRHAAEPDLRMRGGRD